MGQPLRKGETLQAHRDKAQQRMDLTIAVNVLNRMLNGETVKPQQERSTYFTINKLLPSMQAIAVQVEHKIAPNREDLIARALSRGINPDILFANHQAKPLITQDKLDTAQDDSDPPHPPDASE